jgi:hypothetical protein
MNAEAYDVNFQPPVPSVSIENMVNVRAALTARYEQILTLIDEANAMAASAHLGTPRFEVHSANGKCERTAVNTPSVREFIAREVDRCAWGYLMNESGLRTLMDASARKQWDENLYSDKIPALTRENVEATFSSLHLHRREMFERGVITCFKNLSWDFKTNRPFAFGKRIILKYLFSCYGAGAQRSLYLRHEATNELDDLVRVFSIVDGKPEPDHRGGVYSLISQAEHARAFEAEHEYFHVRWFLKGTGHITFKRLDLVERLNDIISRHYPGALPDGRRGDDR